MMSWVEGHFAQLNNHIQILVLNGLLIIAEKSDVCQEQIYPLYTLVLSCHSKPEDICEDMKDFWGKKNS